MRKSIYAKVPEEFQKEDIKWIEIEDLGDGGFQLYLYKKDLNSGLGYDLWFQNKNDAFQCASDDYGIKFDDWLTKEDLQNMGIEVIDEQ